VWSASIDDTQQMRGEHYHFLRLSRVFDGDGPMRMRIFVGADRPSEEVSQTLALWFLLPHIGERSSVGMKGSSHQIGADDPSP
jgi:hypothetical protein